jgi:hypothetical protein
MWCEKPRIQRFWMISSSVAMWISFRRDSFHFESQSEKLSHNPKFLLDPPPSSTLHLLFHMESSLASVCVRPCLLNFYTKFMLKTHRSCFSTHRFCAVNNQYDLLIYQKTLNKLFLLLKPTSRGNLRKCTFLMILMWRDFEVKFIRQSGPG